MTSRKKPGVAFWATVLVVALTIGGCETEQAMTPEALRAGDAEQMDHTPNLRPHIRKLLDEMKAGHLLGAKTSDFRQEFDLADKVTGGGNLATYSFFGVPKTAGQEQSPILFVVVQKKFDRIVRCQVIVPEY